MAERKNFLIPECYVDTNILKTLFRLDGVNHQHCCSKVMKCMSLKFSEGFAVGVVDDDKRKASGSEDFVELAQSPHLIMMKHKSRMHFLFFVRQNLFSISISSSVNSLYSPSSKSSSNFKVPNSILFK